MEKRNAPRVGLFVTCLVDFMRPSVGFAAVKLLHQAGCRVEIPESQTCCGQPAFNSGDRDSAGALARQTIAALEGFDHVVVPSGSCAAQMRDYPSLFGNEPQWRRRADALASRTHELTGFLVDVLDWRGPDGARFPHPVTCHDGCSGLRALNIRAQPRALLARVGGARLRELGDAETCCGFGGTFCVRYPEISTRLADDKCRRIGETGASVLLGGELGCLLNIAGRLQRRGDPIRVYHIAEVLAGMADGPGIGEAGA